MVGSDRVKCVALWRSLGREPGTASRPRLVVFLGVRNGANTFMLSGDDGRSPQQRDALDAAALQRDALVTAAWRRGVPVVLPDEAIAAGIGLNFETLPSADLQRLDAVAKKIGGDLALPG